VKTGLFIVGANTSSPNDFRPATMSPSQEGMEVIAAAISNLQAGDGLRDLPARDILVLLPLPVLGYAFSRRR